MGSVWLEVVVFTALAGWLVAPLEAVFPERETRREDVRLDLGFALVGQGIARVASVSIVGTVLAVVGRSIEVSPIERLDRALGLDPEGAPARGLAVVLGLLVFEAAGYGYHRLAHASPWLFRLHAVHHAPTSLDWLASFRQHPLEIVLTTLAQNLPLVALGLPLGAHASIVVLLRLHTVLVHANVRMPGGLFAALVATPRFHHRHHDRDAPPANFATLFPFFDRLAGTYDGARAESFGLAPDVPTPSRPSLVAWLVHPFVWRADQRRVNGSGFHMRMPSKVGISTYGP